MDRDTYTERILEACKTLELNRLRQVAKVAHEQTQFQARAQALLELIVDVTSVDEATVARAEVIGAEPEAIVWVPTSA